MTTTLDTDNGLEIISTSPQDIARLVVQAAKFNEPNPILPERRQESRRPFPAVISVTPLKDDTYQPASETVSAIGRHLGNLGVDFFHHYLIPEKRAVVALRCASTSWSHFVLELNWSRFIQTGWYLSGGRFSEVIQWRHAAADLNAYG